MNTPRFDLVDIIRIIERRKRYIVIVTLAAMVLGLVFYLVRSKKYAAESSFFVSNPIYSDRSTIFAGSDTRYTDYFGDEDDIDRVIALSSSDTVIAEIIRNTGYDQRYKLDMNKPVERRRLMLQFSKSLDIKRTEYKLLELTFKDKDPVLAAAVANESVKDIEKAYRNFYNTRKKNIFVSISNKLVEVDSSIDALTDTLIRLRAESGINDMISPTRSNLMLSKVTGTAKDLGRYVELIQNYESIKDFLVIDRARYISLLNQYSTGVGPNEVNLLHVITYARPPVDPAGPGLGVVLLASFFLGLFFSILYVLLTTYYREVVLVR